MYYDETMDMRSNIVIFDRISRVESQNGQYIINRPGVAGAVL